MFWFNLLKVCWELLRVFDWWLGSTKGECVKHMMEADRYWKCSAYSWKVFICLVGFLDKWRPSWIEIENDQFGVCNDQQQILNNLQQTSFKDQYILPSTTNWIQNKLDDLFGQLMNFMNEIISHRSQISSKVHNTKIIIFYHAIHAVTKINTVNNNFVSKFDTNVQSMREFSALREKKIVFLFTFDRHTQQYSTAHRNVLRKESNVQQINFFLFLSAPCSSYVFLSVGRWTSSR